MTPSAVALIVGFLACTGAVLGLGYTLRPLESDERNDTRGQERVSLIMALLLGIFLLNLVLSGRYSPPKYTAALANRPYRSGS